MIILRDKNRDVNKPRYFTIISFDLYKCSVYEWMNE